MVTVDIHQPGDHRIVLGDSLKDDAGGSSSLIGIKYNWVPKSGFNHKAGSIKGSENNLKLVFENDRDRYDYEGWVSGAPDERSQLALFYDSGRSVYVLERLAASLDMNIKSATNLPSDQIRRYAPLKRSGPVAEPDGDPADECNLFEEGDDGSPDPSNPFDYRHFIGDAKDVVGQNTHTGGNATPLAGARTPMSGFSSPLPSLVHPASGSTPQFAPIEIVSATNRKLEDYPRRRKAAAPIKTTGARKVPASTTGRMSAQSRRTGAISQERVVDSDTEESASADISERPSPVSAAAAAKSTKSHNRNVSAASALKSPQVVVDDSGLEIESGSPPAGKRKRDYRVDVDVFSRTGTPSHDKSTNRPGTRDTNADVEMHDASDAEDENMKYFEDDDDDEVHPVRDRDVPELTLDEGDAAKSPSPSPIPIQAPKPKRRQSSTVKRRRPRSPSPPPLQHSNTMDDYDGALAAELEAALEEEEAMRRDEDSGVGLGIGVGGSQDDESDVSEEE